MISLVLNTNTRRVERVGIRVWFWGLAWVSVLVLQFVYAVISFGFWLDYGLRWFWFLLSACGFYEWDPGLVDVKPHEH